VIGASIGLIAAGFVPTLLGFAGMIYLAIAVALGLGMFAYGSLMVTQPNNRQAARRLLFASLVYLPVVLLALVLDRV